MINRAPPDFLTPDMADFSVRVADWFEKLRDNICGQFETIESDAEDSPLSNQPFGHFQRKNWTRDGGGGGQISVMHGRVFEKVGVNISVVHGQFEEDFRAQIPGANDDGQFWAGGISLVAHPQNPFVPAAHMNTRFVVTSKAWFGGGGDLTPIMPAEKEAAVFHQGFQACCDRHNPDYYAKYKKMKSPDAGTVLASLGSSQTGTSLQNPTVQSPNTSLFWTNSTGVFLQIGDQNGSSQAFADIRNFRVPPLLKM